MAASQSLRAPVALVDRFVLGRSTLAALTVAGRIVTASVGRRILCRWLTARLARILVGVGIEDIQDEDKDDEF